MSRRENPREKLRRSLVKARGQRYYVSAPSPCYIHMYVRATLQIFTIAVIKILQRVREARRGGGIVPFD